MVARSLNHRLLRPMIPPFLVNEPVAYGNVIALIGVADDRFVRSCSEPFGGVGLPE